MELLSVKESMQLAAIIQLSEKKLSLAGVCERLQVHRGTVWRKSKRYKELGAAGLAHRLRGAPSNRRLKDDLRLWVTTHFEMQYARFGFSPAHFYDLASAEFPQPVSYPTVVRWLRQAGLHKQAHKGRKHHSRRPRKEAFGEMLQMDTSIHDWFGWGKNCALISDIDDCTSSLCSAEFGLEDTTLGNFRVMQNTFRTHGLPQAYYVDRSPIFKVTRTGGTGRILQPTYAADYKTQVQKALATLGIELIYAYSPQAKGRVERSYGTLQKRLVPELRKEGIKEIEAGNRYLKERYIPRHNERFADAPSRHPSAFVPLLNVDLKPILVEKHARVVTNDHVVSVAELGVKLRILPTPKQRSYAKARVDVCRHLDGTLGVYYQKESLPFAPYNP